MACKIDTSLWKQTFFPSGLCSTMNRTVLCYVQQKQLILTSPVILAMTCGSCENLHSICLRLRCLKVDAQSNKERKQKYVDGTYLSSCIKHNKYLKGLSAFATVYVDALTGCIFKCIRLLSRSIVKHYSLKNCFSRYFDIYPRKTCYGSCHSVSR
jgi:hypothetical protein